MLYVGPTGQVTVSLKKNSVAEWFESWFDTEYYHKLYCNRNDDEASAFIEALFQHIKLPAGSKVADIACGKGRHSFVMTALGMDVCGYDLSPNSILAAREKKVPHTSFFVHDIRQPYQEHGFDAAFNLFTSFGYFSDPEDDLRALKNIHAMLKPGGIFVQDYINGLPVTKNLPWHGEERRDELLFRLKKHYNPPHIIKEIEVDDHGSISRFEERVKVYSPEELKNLHTAAGFTVSEVYGDYRLQPFVAAASPRLIIVSTRS